MNSRQKPEAWRAAKIKLAHRDEKARWGDGWILLTQDMRAAFVRANLLGKLAQLETESLSLERRAELLDEWKKIVDDVIQIEFQEGF